MVEINLLANQMIAFEQEDQYALNFHRPSSRGNPSPHATLSSAEHALDDDRVLGMMNCSLSQVKIGKCSQNCAN